MTLWGPLASCLYLSSGLIYLFSPSFTASVGLVVFFFEVVSTTVMILRGPEHTHTHTWCHTFVRNHMALLLTHTGRGKGWCGV